MRQLNKARLTDEVAEQVRRSHAEAIEELQGSKATVLPDRQLADGTQALIPHGLGRIPQIVKVSVPRGAASAGYIVETRDGIDRTKYVAITASGYGATITVDLEIQ